MLTTLKERILFVHSLYLRALLLNYLLVTSSPYTYDTARRMLDLIRDAPAGQLLRWLTKKQILLYPDEREGFVLPALVSVLSIYE